MNTQTKKVNFQEYISKLAGSKEVGLVIAKDKAELSNLAKELLNIGFKQSKNVADLFKTLKTYFVVGDDMDKDVYDFVAQYSTGQVEIFDIKLMHTQTFFPDYKKSAVVMLVEKEGLNKIRKNGFDILSVVGPVFQV
jgi:hypothetical protein